MICNILLLLVCIPIIKYSLNVPNRTLFRKQFIPPHFGLKRKDKIESYFEPYWEKGDWVFNRGKSTKIPQAFFLNRGPKTQHQECNQICPQYVQNYGEVCGVLLNPRTLKYNYKNFKNFCFLELENCFQRNKRLGWFAIKKSNCTGRLTTLSFAHRGIMSRAVWFEKAIAGAG